MIFLLIAPLIYFDFGGVVAEPDSQVQRTHLETLGFPAEALSDSPYFRWMQLHPKEIDYLKQKSEEYHIPLTEDDLMRYSAVKRDSIREIPGIRALVKTLQELQYEVHLITNIRAENFDLVEPFRDLFHTIIHCPTKPGERREIWEMQWALHNKDPSQFLLIDDQEFNVLEAHRLGMQAILFKKFGFSAGPIILKTLILKNLRS